MNKASLKTKLYKLKNLAVNRYAVIADYETRTTEAKKDVKIYEKRLAKLEAESHEMDNFKARVKIMEKISDREYFLRTAPDNLKNLLATYDAKMQELESGILELVEED